MNAQNQESRSPVSLPIHAAQAMRKWKSRRQESFITITLDGSHRVIKARAVTTGLANKTIAHPREVFFPAIKDNAAAVIFGHNHPSGDLTPSPEDRYINSRLCKAAAILGFHVLDHIIVGNKTEAYYSFRENCEIPDGYSETELAGYAGMIAAERAAEREPKRGSREAQTI